MAVQFIVLVSTFAWLGTAKTVRSLTPPMGWNSYNSYNCLPTEDKIKASAHSLVDLGLVDLGYNFATVDCGWNSRDRDAEGRLQWNETLFPSGGKALGDYLHGLGLGFGLYSGAGYFQCGSTDLPASLGFEELDAQSFAEWGGDSLKYDNCYSTSRTNMVDGSSEEAKSPVRFQHMANVLDAVDRDIQYFVCQWGIGTDVGSWAAKIGNTWRMSNDIYNAWRSIWRISNQVVPYYRHTTVGAFADMDMLIVGLHALSYEEERFHFGMWAINKSPLIIGAVLNSPDLPPASLEILSNKDVIAINQDPLAKQAQLMQRFTEEEWDIWLGDLSGDRKVMAVANWKNETQSVAINLESIGIEKATARDVWAATDLGFVKGMQNTTLAGHELKLWILSDLTPTSSRTGGYYSVANATMGGASRLVRCGNKECAPAGQKATGISANSSVSFRAVHAESGGKKLVGVDFINYDYSFQTAWGEGSNVRNMTISVNGGKEKRWAFPLSGGDWFESERLLIEVDGFLAGGGNSVTFRSHAADIGVPDLVGFEIFD